MRNFSFSCLNRNTLNKDGVGSILWHLERLLPKKTLNVLNQVSFVICHIRHIWLCDQFVEADHLFVLLTRHQHLKLGLRRGLLNLEGDHLILWLLVRLHLLRLIGLNLSDVTLEPLVSLLIYPRLIFPEFWPTIWILQNSFQCFLIH